MRSLRGLTALTALTALLLLPLQAVAERQFYASAVSYCSDSAARAIEVDRFLLQYFPDQGVAGAISFDISAASVEANLNPILNFQLDAYGIDAVNTSINLCDLLGGVLCPLPQYDFIGSATIPLPSLVAGKVNVPAAGYWIPDLEATAYVRLLRVEDNTEAACLRVDLSNGKTMRWASVSWALGGLALGAALLSLLWFLVGTLIWPATAAGTLLAASPSLSHWASLARRKERLFFLMSFLQFVATTGLLSLDYPIIYESFTANFAWALGVIRIDEVQTSIDNLRNGTGGNLTQLAGRSNLVGGTSALKSIYARSALPSSPIPSAEEIATAFFEKLGESLPSPSTLPSTTSSFSKRALSALSSTSSSLLRRADTVEAIAIPDVQQQSTINSVSYGFPHALVNLDISPYNAYMTVFINFLFLAAIAIALIVLGAGLWMLVRLVLRRKEHTREQRTGSSKVQAYEQEERRTGWAGFKQRGSGPFSSLVRAGTLRLLLVAWYPLLLFTFYQWTLGSSDSYAPIVLSVFTILFILASLLFLSFRYILIARRALPHSSPLTSEESPSHYAPPSPTSPYRPAAVEPALTPNPSNKALRKAERRQVEDVAAGEMLAAGGAPYSPFWNAYKMRSRRTTAQRRNWWKGRGWWFGIVELVVMPFVLALFISFAKHSGWVQVIALLAIQSITFLMLCIWTPYEDKSSNAAHIFWQLLRVIISGALIVFNESIGLNEIIRVAIGAVLAVIEAVLVVLFFILLVVDFIQLVIFLIRGIKANKRAKHDAANPFVAAPMMCETHTPASPQTGGAGYAMNGGGGAGGLHSNEYATVDRHSSEGELCRARSSLTLDEGQHAAPPVGTWKAV